MHMPASNVSTPYASFVSRLIYWPSDNHKPQQTSKKRKTTLKPSANDSGKFQLLIRDSNEDSGGQELYKYSGRSSSEKDVYAVLFEPQTRRCVFAPVSSHYIFNLTSTPKEKDASKLQKEYDQIKSHQPIGASSDAEDDLFGDGEDQASDGNSDAEPSVFDWRKFVPRCPSTSPEHTSSNYGRGAMSAQNTPLLSAQGGKSSAPSKPKPQPRSQYEPTKSNHRDLLKPRKLAVSPLVAPTRKAAPPAAAKKQARSEAASLPNIRVDPRSSTRAQPRASATAPKPSRDDHSEAKAEREANQPNNSNHNHSNRSEERDNNHEDADADAEEPDDLVLDFDSPTVPTKRPSAWGLAAAASSGPISLRSAASSPGSRLGSPALRQNNRTPTADDDDDMGLEIEVPDADAADAEECEDPWAREREEPTKYTFDDGDEEGEDDEGDRDGEEGSREGGGERGSGIGSGGGSARGGDSDVDALELPSPAADTRRNSEVGRRALSPPDEMDEDEMEAEFLQALASDEDNDDAQAGGAAVGGGVVAQEESESESEEE